MPLEPVKAQKLRKNGADVDADTLPANPALQAHPVATFKPLLLGGQATVKPEPEPEPLPEEGTHEDPWNSRTSLQRTIQGRLNQKA